MAQSHRAMQGRKASGGRYYAARKKKHYELGRENANTTIGKTKSTLVKVKGASFVKAKLQRSEVANVYDPKTKKYEKVKIKAVAENPANRNYVRRNIITKGAVIDTDKGKVKVTSRPGQDGTINGVLVK
ncbi:30S ribosomal protein S8e [Candidatus Woesearchaeota archaeon]|nr:30S ribosomal protein S8e [Candidatus Woesearchaeota archaeon]